MLQIKTTNNGHFRTYRFHFQALLCQKFPNYLQSILSVIINTL